MKKRTKILLSIVSVILVISIVVSAVIFNNRKKSFAVEEKSTLAMGTVVTMKIYDDKKTNLIDSANNLINTLEKTISRRIEGSPVYNLNQNAQCGNDIVSDTIKRCSDVSKLSDGLFDLSIGSVSALWDFGGENERLPKDKEIKAALQTVDYSKVSVSGKNVTCQKGQQLDLGAVGKGLACDFVKQYLIETGVKGAVVSVGGSICAFGTRNKAGDPWRIAIKHPRENEKLLGVINLKEGFVSTSGDYEKYFEKDGIRYHHILNAKTGYPSESGLQSVTVVCSNGMISDALSTACFLLGIENSRELLEKYDASAVFVDGSGKITVTGDVDFEETK